MPFVRGDPRINRTGKRPGQNAGTILRRHLKDSVLAKKLAELVKKGDPVAIRLSCEYLWGKVRQPIESVGQITIRRQADLPARKAPGAPVDGRL